MRKLVSLLAIAALVFAFGFGGAAFAATTKWVDQAGGSDGNDGNTEGMSYATLQFAIDNSLDGDGGTQSVINVKDGTYGAISAGTNPCFAAPAAIIVQNLDFLTIQAAPGHNPKIMPGVGNIVSLAIDNSDHVIIDNIDSDQSTAQFDHWHVCNSEDLTVRNSTFEGANAEDGIDFETSHMTAVIEHNTFRDMIEDTLDFSDGAYSGVYIQDNVFEPNQRRPILIRTFLAADIITGFTIRRNMFLGTNDQEAIRLIGADDITVVNNVIMNSMQQGLYIDAGSTDIKVLHNTFFRNGEEQIRTKESGADIIIKNNIINADSTNAAISADTASLPGEDFNLLFGNGTDTESSQTAITTFGASTITGDPLFVDITGGSEDLNLTAGSPAIDAATDLGVTDDITGAARPVGGGPDMGAYEFGAGPMMIACVGFEPPMDKSVSVKKKNRVLPLKMVLLKNGVPVTDLDIMPPPVVAIDFTGGDPTDPGGEDFLSAGKGDEGNQFVFSGNNWDFNLQSKNFSGTGTYTITAVSGDPIQYVIDPTCTATFVIL